MKLVLFDADGTLVDSQAIIHDSMVLAFEKFGLKAPALEDTKSIVGLSLELAICTLLDREMDRETAEITASYKQSYLSLVNLPEYESRLYPGIRDLIETIGSREDMLIGMVTGKSRAGIDRLLDGQNMRHHFVTSRCADDCPSKPHPAMVLECCGEVGMEPSQAYVIGDTSFDMKMAKSAGSKAIGVAWGYHPEDHLVGSGADLIAQQAHEVLDHIHALADGGASNV